MHVTNINFYFQDKPFYGDTRQEGRPTREDGDEEREVDECVLNIRTLGTIRNITQRLLMYMFSFVKPA